MGVTRQRHRREVIVVDPYLRKPFDIVENADIGRCPVLVTKHKSIVIVFYVPVQVIEVQLHLVGAVEPDNGIGELVTGHVQLRRPDGWGKGEVRSLRIQLPENGQDSGQKNPSCWFHGNTIIKSNYFYHSISPRLNVPAFIARRIAFNRERSFS